MKWISFFRVFARHFSKSLALESHLGEQARAFCLRLTKNLEYYLG